MKRIALDTETTGLSPKDGHRIVEIGCVELDGNIPTGNEWHSYVNPDRTMPEAAFAVHGLSEEFLQKEPKFKDIAEGFLSFIKGGELVIHNAKFDIGFLNSELKMANMPLIEIQKTIDTVHLAREKIPGAAANLDALCKRFEIDLSLREKHGALLDAKLLAEVYLQLTGGRQSSLSLVQEHSNKSKKVINKEEPTLDNLTFIEATLTEREKEEHAEMINKINSSLWLK